MKKNRLNSIVACGCGLWLTVVGARAEVVGLEARDLELAANGDNAFLVVERLESLFNRGKAPDLKTLLGWWAGRNYRVVSGNPSPVAGMLMCNEVVPSRDHGPLFPKVPSRGCASMVDRVEVPSFYEALKPDAIKYYQENEAGFLREVTEIAVQNGSAVWANIPGNLRFDLREALLDPAPGESTPTPVWVLRSTILRDHPEVKAGQTFSWAYFFKKILNR